MIDVFFLRGRLKFSNLNVLNERVKSTSILITVVIYILIGVELQCIVTLVSGVEILHLSLFSCQEQLAT
jgi:hypothetical protein